jgi:hypothetical protein
MNHFLCRGLLWITLGCLAAVWNGAAAEAPASFPVGGLTFKRPEKWTWVETSSPMRKAQLAVPGVESKAPGEVVFFHFGPNNGGGTKANVERWLGQFQEKGEALKSKVEEVTVRAQTITFVRAHGTYLSGMPGGPKTPLPDTTLLGAIVPGAEGAVFIRFTGPGALATASETAFRQMAEAAVP